MLQLISISPAFGVLLGRRTGRVRGCWIARIPVVLVHRLELGLSGCGDCKGRAYQLITSATLGSMHRLSRHRNWHLYIQTLWTTAKGSSSSSSRSNAMTRAVMTHCKLVSRNQFTACGTRKGSTCSHNIMQAQRLKHYPKKKSHKRTSCRWETLSLQKCLDL
jgi:hypothetical protein